MCQNWMYLVRMAKFKNQLKFQLHVAFNVGKFIVVEGGGWCWEQGAEMENVCL